MIFQRAGVKLMDNSKNGVIGGSILTRHYTVRRCKNNKLDIHKQRWAENNHNSTNFYFNYFEIKKINSANNLSTIIMDNVNGDKEITSLLVNKYETLYSSVPTDDNEMNKLHSIINEGGVSQQLQGMVVTSSTIAQCIQCIHFF